MTDGDTSVLSCHSRIKITVDEVEALNLPPPKEKNAKQRCHDTKSCALSYGNTENYTENYAY